MTKPTMTNRLVAYALAGTFASVLVGCATPDSTQDATAQLLALNRSYDAALAAGDPVALDRLYAEDFMYIGPGGVMRSKRQQIDAFASGTVDLLEGSSDDVAVRLYGETAVLTGRFSGRARVDGRVFGFSERYSSVWLRDGRSWRLVLEHGTVVPNEETSEARD